MSPNTIAHRINRYSSTISRSPNFTGKIEHIIAAYRFGIDYINRRVLERQQIVTALSKQQLLEFLAPHLF